MWVWNVLKLVVQRVPQLKYIFGIVGIAIVMAISARLLKPYLETVDGVVVAVNMGVMLLLAILMFVAAANATGKAAGKYKTLYFCLAVVFSILLACSAGLSFSSMFFHYPLDFRQNSQTEPTYSGDYRVEETVVLFDLRDRVATKNKPGIESKEPKKRTDRVVRQRPTNQPYHMLSGTNGLRIENIKSPTHPSMTTETVESKRFDLTTKHTYRHSIPADRFAMGEVVTVELDGVFVNAFEGEGEEWVGSAPDSDTKSLTMVVLFPLNKLCKKATGMEQPTGQAEIPTRAATRPVIHRDGAAVTWTIPTPTKGVGYFIAFEW